jgi:aldehyde dehydrogenase (NAD+)
MVNVARETLPNNLPGSVMSMTLKAPIAVLGGILAWNNSIVRSMVPVGGGRRSACDGLHGGRVSTRPYPC